MDKLDLQTPNFTDENIQKLSELFPSCVTESAEGKIIDFDLLKQELTGNIVEGNKERYQLSWPGKAESLVVANTAINKTLRPNRKESKDFDNTENLFIEGDNLEVLKLLQETYLGKVKMIYIDPPYNTGNDFVYKDSFRKDKTSFDEDTGNKDEEGGRLVSNPDSNGRYHSDWLSMMYSRLKLSRNLLTDDGFIFISIDDNELTNLTKVCNEVFGESNLVNQFVWRKNSSGKTVSKEFPVNIDYILMYSKTRTYQLNPVYKPLSESTISMYNKNDNDGRGKYRFYPLQKTKSPGPETTYDYIDNNGKLWPCPEKGWRMVEKKLKSLENDNRLYIDGPSLQEKAYWDERENEGKVADTLWDDLAENNVGTAEQKKIFGNNLFDNPKPTDLILRCLKIGTSKKNDIVLDYFAGSGTTAHSIMKLNAEDGGSRKCISVQLSEETDEKSEAFKAGFKNIAEICKERIRLSGVMVKADNSEKEEIDKLDVGFRVLKVDSSNMKDVYYTPDSTSQSDIVDLANNIKDDRADEDLLFQVLLDWGIDLSVKIERKEVAGKAVSFADDDYLAACFENNLDEGFVKELIKTEPRKVVLRDSGFESSSVKINVEQLFKQADIEVKVI